MTLKAKITIALPMIVNNVRSAAMHARMTTVNTLTIVSVERVMVVFHLIMIGRDHFDDQQCDIELFSETKSVCYVECHL